MGNKGARGSGAGGSGGSSGGHNGGSSASSAAQHGRRGSVSSTSASHPHGHAPFDLHGPMSSPHTYPLGTLLAENGKPPDRDKDKKHSKPWHRWERDMLKSTFSDLAARSTHHSSLNSHNAKHKQRTGISRDVFLKFFSNVPGVLGERLFHCFNKSGNGLLDLDEFLSGLANYCRGSMEQKVAFLFAMCNLAGNGRVSRVELETMCNSILFAEESLRRHQSAAAAHAVAAEASVALAAQAAASSHEHGPPGGPQAALLHEHLRQMKSRAHSPSFQYSPDGTDGEASFAHEIARATALNAAEAAAAAGEEKKDSAKAAPGASGAAAAAKSLEPRHDGQPDAYSAVATPSVAAASVAPSSSLPDEPLSPVFLDADDNLVHARRVKEMVDDAFAIATPAPASAAAATTVDSSAAASSSLLAPPGASSSSGSVSARPSLSGPDVSSGLSVYHFGRWLQNHPEILDVLDAAFVGKEGLSYLNLNYNQQQQGNGAHAGGEDAASLEQLSSGSAQLGSLSHRGSAADVLTLDSSAANGGGGGSGSSRFPPPSLGLPGHSDGSLAPSPLAVPANSPAASGGDAGFSLASSKSEDKKTWKNGPRLSISSAPTGVQPGSARAGSVGTLMGGNRSASQSHSSAAQQQFHRLGSYPGSATLTAAGAAAAAAAAASAFHLHCDHCGFDITARYCMACGKLLHPSATASTAAQPSTPAASPTTAAHEYSCSHCSVPMFGCGAPRFCLCCGADTRSAVPSGALSTTASASAASGSSSKPTWPLAPRLVAPPVSAPAASHAVEGYLKKVGARLKNVIRRWYSIRDSFMYTYPSARDLKPSHVLFLEGCFVEPVNHEERNAKLKYGIEIILSEASTNGPRQSRVLYASSAESRQQWLDAIRVHANVHDISEFYELGPELGVGRFSSVREGLSKISGKRYAIKVIDKSDLSEREREALRTEVAVLKLVHHPNIIRLKNVFETRKQIFIVMTFVRGGDLFDRLAKRKRFPEPTVQAIMLQLFQVVQYLHVRGIVHRDLKPENIMMQKESESDGPPASAAGGTDGSAAAGSGSSSTASVADSDDTAIMLADFGLGAFALPDQSMKLPCGTLTFTAPEVLIGKGYGMEVDLWSLGVIFFLLIRGRLPFDGKTPDEIREKTIKGQYVIDSHPSWTAASAECKDLIRALLVVDPALRISCNQALEHPFFKLKFHKPNTATTATAAAATKTSAATAAAASSASAAAPPAPSSPTPAPDAVTPAHITETDAAAPSVALRSHLSPGSSLRIVAASPSPSPSFPASSSVATAGTPSQSMGGGPGGAAMSPATGGSAMTPVTASMISTPLPLRAGGGAAGGMLGLNSAHGSTTELAALVVPSSEATSPMGAGAAAAAAGQLHLTAEEGLVLHRSLSLSSLDDQVHGGGGGRACSSPGADDDDSAESNIIRFEEDPADHPPNHGEGGGSPSSALSPITIMPYPTPASGAAGSTAAANVAALPAPSSAFNSDTDDHDLDGADSDGAGGMGMKRPPSMHLLSRFLSPPSTFAPLNSTQSGDAHHGDSNARDSDEDEEPHDMFRRSTHEHRQA